MGSNVVKYLRGINLIYAEETSVKSYFGYNAHGDVVQLTNSSGAVTKTYRYDAFGVEDSPSSTDTNVWRYCGEYWDVETETIYLRARYYNPRIGRFTQQDSFRGYMGNALSLNMYTYCYNNPIRYIDFWGFAPTELEAAKMAADIYNATYVGGDVRNPNVIIAATDLHDQWILVDIIYDRFDSGVKIGVYAKYNGNEFEYALVNKGSSTGEDWANNFQQPFGASNQMKDSLIATKEFVDNHPLSEITMVGHSKGGAEAAANAVATGTNAIIFNPSIANFFAYPDTLIELSNYDFGKISVFIVEGEALDNIFNTYIYYNAFGAQVTYLPTQYEIPLYMYLPILLPMRIKNEIENLKDNHQMRAVINTLKEAGYR